MRTKLGSLIREARLAAGLTQEHLGRRLGLKGRAIYRWERNESAPTGRHRRTLVQEIQAVNPQAAAKLKAALTPVRNAAGSNADATVPSQAALPPPPRTPAEVIELAALKLADELDVTARRLRRPLARFIERVRIANIAIETAQGELERLIGQE